MLTDMSVGFCGPWILSRGKCESVSRVLVGWNEGCMPAFRLLGAILSRPASKTDTGSHVGANLEKAKVYKTDR